MDSLTSTCLFPRKCLSNISTSQVKGLERICDPSDGTLLAEYTTVANTKKEIAYGFAYLKAKRVAFIFQHLQPVSLNRKPLAFSSNKI